MYDLEQKRRFVAHPDGDNYQWAPNRDMLAFKTDSVLNTRDVSRGEAEDFQNVSLGVGNYGWLPDGSGFLVSAPARLLPTGWTPIQLFKVPLDAKADPKKISPFFTLPAESKSFFAVQTSTFKWSHDGKWISFIAEPTASLSMDSNTLCVLTSKGKRFHQLDKMLRYESWF